MEAKRLSIWFFAACLAVLAPSLRAHEPNFEIDDYWRQRAEEAQNAALEAYHPNPEEVADGLNYHVHRSVHRSMSLQHIFFNCLVNVHEFKRRY